MRQRYLLLKQEIRYKTERVTDTLDDQQKRAILDQDQGRKEGKEDFLPQIGNSLDILVANAI